MSKLKEILQRKAEREVKLKSSMESITKQLIALGALKVILFGSLSRGDVDVYSDLDLLVIMPSAKRSETRKSAEHARSNVAVHSSPLEWEVTAIPM